MNGRFLGAVAAVAIIGCVGAPTAFATTNVLPDPSFGGLFFAAGKQLSITGLGWHTLSNTVTSNGVSVSVTTTAHLAAEPFPSVFASAQRISSIPGGGLTILSSAGANYDIEITGPTPNVLVDVSGWASLGASGTPSIFLIIQNDLIFSKYTPGTFSFDMPVLVPTGSLIPVELNASASLTGVPAAGSLSASAYLDPYFSIDPSNADPGAYSILTSPGVGNAPSPGVVIPETSTWAMMLLGFAGLGFASLRHRDSRAFTVVRPRERQKIRNTT
jgi:hypothetical protein